MSKFSHKKFANIIRIGIPVLLFFSLIGSNVAFHTANWPGIFLSHLQLEDGNTYKKVAPRIFLLSERISVEAFLNEKGWYKHAENEKSQVFQQGDYLCNVFQYEYPLKDGYIIVEISEPYHKDFNSNFKNL